MSSVIERLTGRPALLDLFGWVESGLPMAHVAPGTHGIRIEEELKDGTYLLRAELPGIDPEKNVEISLTEDVLVLRAERATETTDKHHTEFRYGTFTRSVRLPAGARSEEATAEYKDGVLTIAVPVPEEKKDTRTIPVRHV
ncbi:Hsp20/alpha crystallin family protein [Streptomyces sp. CRN 30]|uniref:Hsp20/alpha crystallin family protein n=1 Tax=Streptomyces sp. CRN 30 TaxID=3075613 RepID=UPI002A822A01|nr:Hsp20/alpha crystallin family protein [Streptomyces sp. CRN 30]